MGGEQGGWAGLEPRSTWRSVSGLSLAPRRVFFSDLFFFAGQACWNLLMPRAAMGRKWPWTG